LVNSNDCSEVDEKRGGSVYAGDSAAESGEISLSKLRPQSRIGKSRRLRFVHASGVHHQVNGWQ